MTASGASNLTLGTILDVASLSDTTGVDTYNFGGVAGTLSATIAANGSVSVTGAAGIDTITASADMTRSTSARTQTYNLGNGNDSITFQSGTVALVGAVANKLVLNGDAGDDSFRYATAAANTDLVTIAGGAGSDTLFVTGAPANGPTATASGLEGITFNNTADATTTLAWTGGATDIVTITELNGNAETLNITTVAGSGVLNTGNWVVQGWGAGDFLNISGDAGNDTLGVNTGVASGEVLKGGAGNDTLNGFAGADSITGGLGADRLTGGAGIDDFNLVKADSTLAAMDIITDFRAATGDNAGAADTITITDQKAVASVVNTTVLARADATFAAALDAVATLNATDLGLSVFTYGGNTYAYVETIATGIAYVADDCLIQIVGTPWAAGTVIAGSGLGIDAV
jgi:Ca2+-binding RTX toxin-like protein